MMPLLLSWATSPSTFLCEEYTYASFKRHEEGPLPEAPATTGSWYGAGIVLVYAVTLRYETSFVPELSLRLLRLGKHTADVYALSNFINILHLFLLPSTSKILLLFGDVCTAVDETPIQTTLGPWVLTKHIGTRDRILSQSHPKSLSPEFGQSPKVPKEIWDEARSQLRVRLREIEDGKQVQTVQSLQRFL